MAEIAFKIEGRKVRDGYENIVTYGTFPSEEPSNYDGGTLITQDKLIYRLKQNSNYCLYSLIDKNTWAIDDNGAGNLVIVVIIPTGWQLTKKNISPYLLLREIYDTFQKEYMTESEYLPKGVHRFKDVPSPDASVFKEVIDKYKPLVKGDVIDTIYMGDEKNCPTGILRVKEKDMKDFFSFTQYSAFEKFSSIEISENCDSTVKGVVIPRPYYVYVNGDNKPYKEITDTEENVEINLGDDGYSIYKSVSFTIEEIRNIGGTLRKGAATFILDDANRKVICSISGEEILYETTIEYSRETTLIQKNIIDSLIRKGYVTLSIDGINDLTEKQKAKTIKGLKGKAVVVTPKMIDNHYILSAEQTSDVHTRKLTITISVKTKETQQVVSKLESVSALGTGNKDLIEKINKLEKTNKEYEGLLSKSRRKSKVWKLVSACATLLLIIGGVIAWMLSQKKVEDNNSAFISILNKDYYRTLSLNQIITYDEVKNAADLCVGIEKTEIIDKIFSADKDGSGKSNLPDSVLEMRQPFSWEKLYGAIKETNKNTKLQTTDDYQRYIKDYVGCRSLVYINNGMWDDCKKIYKNKKEDNCTQWRIGKLDALFELSDLDAIKKKVKEYIDSTHSWIKTWEDFDKIIGPLNQQTNVSQSPSFPTNNQKQLLLLLSLYNGQGNEKTLMPDYQRKQALQNIVEKPEYKNLDDKLKGAIRKVYTCKAKYLNNAPEKFNTLEEFLQFANTIQNEEN